MAMGVSFISSGGCCDLSFFLENSMDSVLEGLKVTSQTLYQLDIARRSEFKMLADNANRRMFPLTSATISLMYNMKRRGPAVTLAQGENEFDTITLCFRPNRFEINQLRRLPLMPIEESL